MANRRKFIFITTANTYTIYRTDISVFRKKLHYGKTDIDVQKGLRFFGEIFTILKEESFTVFCQIRESLFHEIKQIRLDC